MRKLRLDLEAVQVESFATQPAGAERGTVDARQGRETWTCPIATNDTCLAQTCGCGGGSGYTCVNCNPSDGGTCWDATCESCMATCNHATGPQRCCAIG